MNSAHGSFKLGDRVTWTSQAGGCTRTKTGEVVEVVPAFERPKTHVTGMGYHRNHESYAVRASKTTDRKREAFYWPRVNQLKKAFDGTFNEQTLREEIVRVWGPAGAHVYDMLLAKAKEYDRTFDGEKVGKLAAREIYEALSCKKTTEGQGKHG